jgi:hypothetical protein
MSERGMSEAEELVLEAASAVLAMPPERLVEELGEGEEGQAMLRRQGLEVFTLLALGLPREAPSRALRQRLLASLAGDETQWVPQLSERGGVGALDPETGSLDPEARAAESAAPEGPEPARPRPVARPVPEPPRPVAAPGPAPPRALPAAVPAALPGVEPARWRWPVALAATLAAVLGLVSGLLWRELEATRGRLTASEQARGELAAEVAAAAAREQRGAAQAADLAALRASLAMVTAAGTEVCVLQPPDALPVAPEAKGLLFVADDHRHWYLRAQGLEPPDAERAYHLWFVVGDRPVSAGAFRVEGAEAVLSSPTMPEGTSAAMVTLEPVGRSGDRPSGPVVLYGSDFVRL